MNIFKAINHYRVVKILYTVYMSLFMFIMEINLFAFVRCNKATINDLLILILLGFFMEYLLYKEKNPKLILLILSSLSLFYSIIIYFIFGDENYCILSFVLNLIYILIHNKFNETNIDNYHYKSLGKMINIILVLSAVFCISLTSYETNYLFKAYLAYLIAYILLLRESRRYSFKLYKKEDNIITSLYILFIIFMFTPICSEIAKIIFKGVAKLVEGAAYILVTILYYTIGLGALKIKELIYKNPIQSNNKKEFIEGFTENLKDVPPDARYNTWFFIIAYIVLAALIILALIYVFKKIRFRTIEKDEFIEVREKVDKICFNKKVKKYNYENNKEKDKNRSFIFAYYRKFLKLAWKNGLYKKYMTSRQVKSMVRTEISNKDEELKILSEIYNEAKFSNHNLNEEKVKNVENAYEQVKKVLK